MMVYYLKASNILDVARTSVLWMSQTSIPIFLCSLACPTLVIFFMAHHRSKPFDKLEIGKLNNSREQTGKFYYEPKVDNPGGNVQLEFVGENHASPDSDLLDQQTVPPCPH